MAVDAEINAMSEIINSLVDLDDEARVRVLRWVADRYGIQIGKVTAHTSKVAQGSDEEPESEFEDVATLYDRANPKTDAEKAIVVGYWFQEIEGKSELGSQEINTQLKHLGHGVKNITSALSDLIKRKPRLVIQVQKSGKSQQARKKYKITNEGVKFVKKMLLSDQDE